MAGIQRTAITKDGQRYVDEPVYSHLRMDQHSSIAHAVSAAFNGGVSKLAIAGPRVLLGYQRVCLRWMKPDGNGGLVPR